MKKVTLTLCAIMLSSLIAADPTTLMKEKENKELLDSSKEVQKYNKEVFQKLDDKIDAIYRSLDEAKKAKASGGSASLDASTLPTMQGSYTISKNGKPLLSEIYVQDGNGKMYLNKHNNNNLTSIDQDHATYKAGGTTVKTPIVYGGGSNTALNKPLTTTMKTDHNINNSNASINLMPPPLAKTIKKEDF